MQTKLNIRIDFRSQSGASEVNGMDLTKDEAYAIAEFIDFNIFNAIRDNTDWDSLYNLRNLIHGYEKCCKLGNYVGVTDKMEEQDATD